METPPPAPQVPDEPLEPAGFVVVAESGERIHFLDWGGSAESAGGRGVLAIHGLSQTGWIWAPIARRLGGPSRDRRFVTMDLRGHGLSDAPTEDGAYDLAVLATDAVAVAEGSGLLVGGDGLLLVGHGFGAIVAAMTALELGDRCTGLVLVDGGWEALEASTGLDPDEFLRGLEEPPEVMRSLAAFLADRIAFDPGTWDNDQERAALATVVETHAGRVVPATRPHALEACARAMFTYDPLTALTGVPAPVVALAAADDELGTRMRALAEVSAARAAAGREAIEVVSFRHDGHNLMRYRPGEVASAIDSLAGTGR